MSHHHHHRSRSSGGEGGNSARKTVGGGSGASSSTSAAAPRKPLPMYQQRPWIELYRPQTIDKLLLPDTTRKLLENSITDKTLCNLVICGPPGVGKTSTINCLAQQLLGDRYRDCVIELNSSNDRGVSAIQSVEDFCKKSSVYVDTNGKTVTSPKIILYDEADRITDKAQMVIVQLMDKYPKVSFTFTCNESSLIIEAIQSKCTILRYLPIPRDLMTERLTTICDAHGAKYTKEGIKRAVLYSKGDMRRAINIAQSVWSGFGTINPEGINRLYPVPSLDTIVRILELCKRGKLNDVLTDVHAMQISGTSTQDILSTLQIVLNTHPDIDDKFRMHALKSLGQAMFAISMFQTQLQLDACFASICAYKLKR